MSGNSQPSPGRKAITGPDLPVPDFAPRYFSPAILAGGWLFCSGAMATDYKDAVDEVGYTDPDALHRPGSARTCHPAEPGAPDPPCLTPRPAAGHRHRPQGVRGLASRPTRFTWFCCSRSITSSTAS